MPNDSSDYDDALLARLNALKKSNISLDVNPALNQGNDTTNSSIVLDQDDLLHRFRNLTGAPNSSTAVQSVDPVLEPSHEQDEDEGKTVEELLAELGPEEQWTLDSDEPNDIQKLLLEARNVLSQEAESSSAAGPAQHAQDSTNVERGEEVHCGGTLTPALEVSVQGQSDLTEDEEAALYLQQILDEAKLDGETEVPEEPSPHDKNSVPMQSTSPKRHLRERALSPLDMPCAPNSMPFLPSPSKEDNVAPALDLPSAPTAAPTTRSKIKSNTPKLPVYSDKEIETWCVICSDDATVKCLGCEGDLYCAKCWKEGHIGKDIGYEERGHRWVKYRQAGSRV